MKNSVPIADLRPTQLTLGLDEVKKRANQIAKMSADERDAYVREKAIPYVLGPERRIYMIDHHHFARALWSADIREARLGKMEEDWSDLDAPAFWRKMDARGFCWPIDADGNRRPYSTIPHHISELTDNVWRTLARRVRGKAFDDQDTPFQEFMWGEYFRTFMSQRLLRLHRKLARKIAVKVAALNEAEDLPGYRPPSKRQRISVQPQITLKHP